MGCGDKVGRPLGGIVGGIIRSFHCSLLSIDICCHDSSTLGPAMKLSGLNVKSIISEPFFQHSDVILAQD